MENHVLSLEDRIVEDNGAMEQEYGAAVEVRTGRFVTVRLSNFMIDLEGSSLFLTWTHRNGLPDNCFLLVPFIGNGLCVSFKSNGKGWKKLQEPYSPLLQFEIRIDDELNDKSTRGEPAILQFTLFEKKDRIIRKLGQAGLLIVKKCTKNPGKTIDARFTFDKEIQEILKIPVVDRLPIPKSMAPKKRPLEITPEKNKRFKLSGSEDILPQSSPETLPPSEITKQQQPTLYEKYRVNTNAQPPQVPQPQSHTVNTPTPEHAPRQPALVMPNSMIWNELPPIWGPLDSLTNCVLPEIPVSSVLP